MKSLNISIVIPNWNGKDLLAKHLPSVLAAAPKAEIIVVDDRSQDDSVKFLRENFLNVICIEKKKHEGFASTVNAGVAASSGDIVVLLNTDVRPEKGFLSTLIPHFDDPLVFAVGCLDKSIEKGKVVFRGRGEAQWRKGFFIHCRGEVTQSNTAWVSGGSGAFRRSMWLTLGGMDSIYNPFYWEDIDLSYRALKAGYRVVFEPKSIVVHYHEEGKIQTIFTPRFVKQIAYRNQFTFIWKNASDIPILLAHALWTPARLTQAIIHGDFTMVSGYLDALFLLPYIVLSRIKQSQLWRRKDIEIFTPHS